jgi:hypothetical protein
MAPNFDLPDSEFAPADFAKLSSEFKDEYVGQYIVFDAQYASHEQGMLMPTPKGRPVNITDLMCVSLMKPPSVAQVKVIWDIGDRELGRPFLNVAFSSPVRIYAYMARPNEPLRHKSRTDTYFKGFPSPTLVLVKAVANP